MSSWAFFTSTAKLSFSKQPSGNQTTSVENLADKVARLDFGTNEKGPKDGSENISGAATPTGIDIFTYYRLEERLQSREKSVSPTSPGSTNALLHVKSDPQSRTVTDGEDDELRSISVRLLTALSNRPDSPVLRSGEHSEHQDTKVAFRYPFPRSPRQGPKFEPVNSSNAAVAFPAKSPKPKNLTQYEEFEQKLFENAAILCDEKATCVEYTEWNDMAQDWNMVHAASESRVLIIRKMARRPSAPSSIPLSLNTSIWVLSSDGSVQLEQGLDSRVETIPYTAWGDTLKVAIRQKSTLKFHTLSESPPETVQTNWISYVFLSETGSASFQSTLLDRTLLLSVRTSKTVRVTGGLVSSQEQLCGLENLRLWKEADSGKVWGMIHFKPQVRVAYLTFQLNSTLHPLQVKEDGHRGVKIQGIELPTDARRPSHPPKASKGDSGKKPDVKIEFATEAERNVFVKRFKEVQGMTHE
jgi:hypothetical protein